MNRRTFLMSGLGATLSTPIFAALQRDKLDAARRVLADAVQSKQVDAAVIFVQQGESTFHGHFGAAKSIDDIFLLASISKPMSITALMTLYDRNKFKLDDTAKKFIPAFTGDGREKITIRHLLTHTCGLPDQLANNQSLRKRHAPLSEFVRHAIRTPPKFAPGSKYSYSSMGILLATEIARRISGTGILEFVNQAVFQPLGMTRSALGVGTFSLDSLVRCQVIQANPESGSGDPTAKNWDWNSEYWRKFGAPWGGAHGSAPDVACFLSEFLHPTGKLFRPETARLMVKNHNPAGMTPRGLGFRVGASAGGQGCSEQTFGHTGATGTLCWADPATDTICVVLTTLPARAVRPHPRNTAADLVGQAVR